MPVPETIVSLDPCVARNHRWPTREQRYTTGRVLVAIVITSLVFRLGSATFQGDTIETLPGVYDQVSYDALAMQVIGGHGFSFAKDWWPATSAGQPTAHWSFLYTLYLAFIYSVFGHHPIAARLVQATVAGVVHPWLTWRIGNRLFGTPFGATAAALASVYAYFVFYAGALMTETFFILAILAAFDLATAIRQRRKGRLRHWVFMGLAVGSAVLLRQVFLIFVPLLFGWILWPQSGDAPGTTRQRARGVLIAAMVLSAMVLPWTLRNYAVFGRFVLLNTNAGYAMFWANHPIHGTTFIPVLPEPQRSYRELIPPEWLALDEAELDQKLLKEGFRFVREDPGRYLLLSLSRLWEYWRFWPSSQSGLASNLSRVFSIGLLFPFMSFGLWHAARLRRRDDVRRNLILAYLFVGVYSLIHVLSWTLPRYRLPIDAVLVIFAAAGILRFGSRFFSLHTQQTQ